MFSKTKLEKINPKGLFLHSFPVNAKCKKNGALLGPKGDVLHVQYN